MLKQIGGKIEDKPAFIKALKERTRPETLRGPVRFDEFGNVVGNIYIRKVERKGGKLVNAVVKTYPNVSQFWTYKQDEFLKNPVYSRDFPPAKEPRAVITCAKHAALSHRHPEVRAQRASKEDGTRCRSSFEARASLWRLRMTGLTPE